MDSITHDHNRETSKTSKSRTTPIDAEFSNTGPEETIHVQEHDTKAAEEETPYREPEGGKRIEF